MQPVQTTDPTFNTETMMCVEQRVECRGEVPSSVHLPRWRQSQVAALCSHDDDLHHGGCPSRSC